MSKKKKPNDSKGVFVHLDETARMNLDCLKATHSAPVKAAQIFREALADKANQERAKKPQEVAV